MSTSVEADFLLVLSLSLSHCSGHRFGIGVAKCFQVLWPKDYYLWISLWQL